MTTVVLTGVAGFIGSHIVEHLAAHTDWRIVGLASFRHRGDMLRLDGLPVELYHADLSAPISPRLADRIGPVDYIINAASESHVDRSIAEPRAFIENNVSLAITMLEYARLVRPRAFVQVSTDEVYGPAEGLTEHAEWSPILPSNPYAASKAAQEAIATSYWRTFGVPLIITNTMNNFGERQDEEKFIPTILRSLIEGSELVVHGTPLQIGSRFYLHARNHADALLYLLQTIRPAQFSGPADRPDRYHVRGEREIDNLSLAREVADIAGLPLRYRLEDFHSTRPGHDPRYALAADKLTALGWTPPLDLDESLARTVRWSLAHPEWLGAKADMSATVRTS
jgi:dTDP-glucose 4,6-dehydratase